MISQKLSGIEDLLQSDMIDNILDWGFDFLKKGVSYLMKNELIIELLKNIKPDLLKEGKVRFENYCILVLVAPRLRNKFST